MTLFPAADEMRDMLSPVARDAEEQLGSVVSLYTVSRVRRPDGTYGPGAPVLVAADVAMKLRSVALKRAQEIFGLDTDVRMTGKTNRANPLPLGMVVVVTGGDFLDQTFEITDRVELPLSDSYVIGLKEHPVVAV